MGVDGSLQWWPSLMYLMVLSLLFKICNGNVEVKALMEMKVVLDPENRILSSWTSDGNPCSGSFEGVACNEHGKVANISLQSKGLYGRIPAAVSGLRCLSGLYLHYNSLTGDIPKDISNLTELIDLYLDVNNLSGNIPAELGFMASLQVLQLCCNQLTGGIPKELGSLKKLSVLALQSNRLTGAIPATLGDLKKLSMLALQSNLLIGAIPASLGDLAMLMRLDLSFNQLTGSIPGKLTGLSQLNVLDVRNNSLSGNVPTGFKRLNGGFLYENNSALCGVGFSTLRACTTSDLNPIRPEPYGPDGDIPQSANIGTHCTGAHCSNSSKTRGIAVIMAVVAVALGGTVSGLLIFSWYRRRKQKIGSAFELSGSRTSTDQTKDLSRKSVSPLISLEYSNGWDPLADDSNGGFSQEVLQSFRFNLEEVESATQYYSEVNLLGKSNFAAIYRGVLRDGSVVAIKSINKTSCKTEELEFLKGLKILTSLRHENLVGLRGFCCSRGRGECFLIYDFIGNGSLARYLDAKDGNGRFLDWSTRVRIINGVAKGIEYLHNNTTKSALVHQSISAEKVLLDQNFKPLLSDSGLHKLLADDVVFSTLKASAAMGYLAPEYTTVGRFTEKSDVYAFGVMLFQILSGKKKVNSLTRIGLEPSKVEDYMDPNLQGKFSVSEAGNLAAIAVICTNEAPNQRPTMAAVVKELANCNC